jgi:hypothetical protein
VGQPAETGDADPEFELCYADERGAERRELPVSWPGLQAAAYPEAIAAASATHASRKSSP